LFLAITEDIVEFFTPTILLMLNDYI